MGLSGNISMCWCDSHFGISKDVLFPGSVIHAVEHKGEESASNRNSTGEWMWGNKMVFWKVAGQNLSLGQAFFVCFLKTDVTRR